MNKIESKARYDARAVAAAIQVYWEMNPFWEFEKCKNLRALVRKRAPNSGLKSLPEFLHEYITPNCKLSRGQLAELILSLQLRFRWIRLCFDGSDGYEKIDQIHKKLKRIRKLSAELAELTSNVELFYLAGESLIDFTRIQNFCDGVGETHQTKETFYGGVMTRICIDCTVMTEALADLEARVRRTAGQPPKIAHNWLIGDAMDLFELMQGQPVIYSTPTKAESFVDYAHNDFLHFMIDLAGMFEPEKHQARISNTGYPSKIAKGITLHRSDPTIRKGLIPENEIPNIIHSINALSSLK